MAGNRPQLLTGARAVIQKSNATTGALETVAFATDVNVNERAGVTTTHVMGRMNGAANDPTSYDVDVSIGRVIPMQDSTGKTPAGSPWTPPVANGQSAMQEAPTAVGSNLQPSINLMSSAYDFTIALYDQVTGVYVASVYGARYAGRSQGTASGSTSNERLNYVGLWNQGYNSQENTGTLGYGV